VAAIITPTAEPLLATDLISDNLIRVQTSRPPEVDAIMQRHSLSNFRPPRLDTTRGLLGNDNNIDSNTAAPTDADVVVEDDNMSAIVSDYRAYIS